MPTRQAGDVGGIWLYGDYEADRTMKKITKDSEVETKRLMEQTEKETRDLVERLKR